MQFPSYIHLIYLSFHNSKLSRMSERSSISILRAFARAKKFGKIPLKSCDRRDWSRGIKKLDVILPQIRIPQTHGSRLFVWVQFMCGSHMHQIPFVVSLYFMYNVNGELFFECDPCHSLVSNFTDKTETSEELYCI